MTLTIIASAFLLIGGFFALVAALGVFRFVDFYSRIHAAAKASTFGLGFSALAAALVLETPSAWLKAACSIVFLFASLPIATHLLCRSVRHTVDCKEPFRDRQNAGRRTFF